MLLLSFLMLAACSRHGSPPVKDAVAIVNGHAITELDLELKLKNDMHQAEMKPGYRSNVLEAVIRDELMAQKAVELGLEQDPQYQAELRQFEAQLAAFKRKKLAERFAQSQLTAKVDVSDEEARRYFEQNRPRMSTELHVLQILRHDEASIEQARRALAEGTPFETVARAGFPNLPPDATPWDRGYLAWVQVPQQWRNVVYDLASGQTSGIIRGPGRRFWIVRVIERRENPNVDFATLRASIADLLRNAKNEEAWEQAERDLRKQAHITYYQPAAGN